MDEIKPGLWPDVPEKFYFKIPAVNKHSLDQIDITPAHYLAAQENEPDDTRAQVVGRAFHCATLEPELFRLRYAVNNYWKDFRSKPAQLWRDEVQSSGMDVLSRDEYRQAFYMADSIRSHAKAKQLLARRDTLREQTAIWVDDDLDAWRAYGESPTFLLCKARADALNLKYAAIVDIKSCDDASEWNVRKVCVKHRYDVQAAYYLDGFARVGFDAKVFIFIFVEKNPPYAIGIFYLDAGDIRAARATYKSNLLTLSSCYKQNTWPGYPENIRKLSLLNY